MEQGRSSFKFSNVIKERKAQCQKHHKDEYRNEIPGVIQVENDGKGGDGQADEDQNSYKHLQVQALVFGIIAYVGRDFKGKKRFHRDFLTR